MDLLGMTIQQWSVLAALLVAGIGASYRFQFQSLYYILAVIYAVHSGTDALVVNQWVFTTFIYLVVCMVSGFWRGTTK